MTDEELLASQFEAHRGRLRAVAYRMLGSLAEADDAVQEAWLRLTRSGAAVENLGGWLTTVIARVSVDMLRARRRVRGQAPVPDPDLNRQRQVVEAFFAAARDGDFATLISLLDPRAVARSDDGTAPRVLRGPAAIARQALTFASPAAQVRPALVNGAAGVIVTIGQAPVSVMSLTITHGKITEINSISDPARLQRLDIPQP